MVSFQLAPEQQDLRDSVAQFARDVVAPVIGGYYERGEFPYDIVARMGKLGLFGLPFPEEYGGMGGDYFALCLALEELARVDSSVAITLEAGVSLGAMPIVHAENGDLIWHLQQYYLGTGMTGPEGHAYSRPPAVEGEATNRAIMIADMAGCPVYIVHTSSRDAHEAIARARAAGTATPLIDLAVLDLRIHNRQIGS